MRSVVGTIKILWNILSWALVIGALVLAILLVGVRIVKITPYTVLSSSMEPVYSAGDMIYVKSVDTTQLNAGDIITYKLTDDTLSTHRIAAVNTEDDGSISFTTKGDNNDFEDARPVEALRVIGSPVFSIPKLGYVASYIHTIPLPAIIIFIVAVIAIFVIFPMLLPDDRKNPDRME